MADLKVALLAYDFTTHTLLRERAVDDLKVTVKTQKGEQEVLVNKALVENPSNEVLARA